MSCRLPNARSGPSAVWVAATLLAVTLGLLALLVPSSSAQTGLTLRGLGGESMTEAELTRGPTVIVVWASWSPRGRDVVSRVSRIQSRWGSASRVVMVNFQEDRATIEEFLQGRRPPVPVLMDPDGAFAKKHAVTTLPGLLVFQGGRVAYRGRLPDDPDDVLADLLE